ncbi:non-specific lipid transfer protein GPI-anchored 13-like [Phoenix dactylifera]|uniref:Non-specific lipid transfer protein GPI-anchored 13-like n=1 Tax=Phoenix dactylifera TaxID=42345 RepID=A0A8B9AMX5_PHODC|nr:non-specific lipid transfer protein GPI-anchored 13-like [Phoenix dactylifera]
MAMAKYSMMLLLPLLATVPAPCQATLEEDEKECADQLQNLAPCVPYVSGSAPKPTPECCADAEKVRASQPKCLCVLIVESTDPSLALPINTTLALHMPAACNSDAKVSNCPSILKLNPSSPEARIFKDASGDATASTSASSSTPTDSASGSASGGGSGAKTAPNNRGGRLESFVGGGVAVASLVVCSAVLFM